MSSSGSNQLGNETSILHIDATKLQAVVAAAVTTFLTHINSGNTTKTNKGVESSDCSTNPGSQQMTTVTDLRSRKTEKRRRYRQARSERKRFQRLSMQQQQVATPAPSTPARPIPPVPGIETNPTHKSSNKVDSLRGNFQSGVMRKAPVST